MYKITYWTFAIPGWIQVQTDLSSAIQMRFGEINATGTGRVGSSGLSLLVRMEFTARNFVLG